MMSSKKINRATSTNPEPQSSKRQDTGASSLVNNASNSNLQVVSQNASDDLISLPENLLSNPSSYNVIH